MAKRPSVFAAKRLIAEIAGQYRRSGVDGVTPNSIVFGVELMLNGLREDLKAREFRPERVREKTIPKANGTVRSLGIPTVRDRVVQASLKLVLEPIFEADFKPCSCGFRPNRRAQDAIAEIHFFGTPTRNYERVFEADIKACFDEIDHSALMDRVRDRIGDKRVLWLVTSFLKAGVLSEDAMARATITGTPKAESCHRFWPTSPCPFLTSTSPPNGKRSDRNRPARSAAEPGNPS